MRIPSQRLPYISGMLRNSFWLRLTSSGDLLIAYRERQGMITSESIDEVSIPQMQARRMKLYKYIPLLQDKPQIYPAKPGIAAATKQMWHNGLTRKAVFSVKQRRVFFDDILKCHKLLFVRTLS